MEYVGEQMQSSPDPLHGLVEFVGRRPERSGGQRERGKREGGQRGLLGGVGGAAPASCLCQTKAHTHFQTTIDPDSHSHSKYVNRSTTVTTGCRVWSMGMGMAMGMGYEMWEFNGRFPIRTLSTALSFLFSFLFIFNTIQQKSRLNSS